MEAPTAKCLYMIAVYLMTSRPSAKPDGQAQNCLCRTFLTGMVPVGLLLLLLLPPFEGSPCGTEMRPEIIVRPCVRPANERGMGVELVSWFFVQLEHGTWNLNIQI